jgi:hypothetical protein
VPEVCRFGAIVIQMYWKDENPPHFHAIGPDGLVRVEIRTRNYRRIGKFHPRDLRLVLQWAAAREAELLAAWDEMHASPPKRPSRIDPL